MYTILAASKLVFEWVGIFGFLDDTHLIRTLVNYDAIR